MTHPPPTEAQIAKFPILCKRTNDPKLAWIEKRCAENKLRVYRCGQSAHAPILRVHPADEACALRVLIPVDDIPDNDPQFLTT